MVLIIHGSLKLLYFLAPCIWWILMIHWLFLQCQQQVLTWLLDRLIWHLVNTFIFPSGWTAATLMIPNFSSTLEKKKAISQLAASSSGQNPPLLWCINTNDIHYQINVSIQGMYNSRLYIHLHICMYCILCLHWLPAWLIIGSDIQHFYWLPESVFLIRLPTK